MPSPADPIAAVAAYLGLDSNVVALAGGRVYTEELPRRSGRNQVVARMPLDVVVVRGAGGANRFEPSYLPLRNPRVDVISYGRSDVHSRELANACWNALREMGPFTFGGTRLYSAECEMEPSWTKDPERDWIYYVSSWRVTGISVAVA